MRRPYTPLYVGVMPESGFELINVEGTRLVAEAGRLAGVARLGVHEHDRTVRDPRHGPTH